MTSDPSHGTLSIALAPQDIHFTLLATSLHPHLNIQINTSTPSTSLCAAHLLVFLPDSVFVDRDELLDLWSDLGPADWTLTPPVIDIERPVRLDMPEVQLGLVLDLDSHGKASIDVPLHARYLLPQEEGHEIVRVIEQGRVKGGMVCGADSLRPLEAQDLAEFHVEPLVLTLPTGKMSHQPYVELGTTAAIWLGFIWLAYKIVRLGRRSEPHNIGRKVL